MIFLGMIMSTVRRKNLIELHVNIRGTDQPANARNLNSAVCNRSLESMMNKLGTCNVSQFKPVLVA